MKKSYSISEVQKAFPKFLKESDKEFVRIRKGKKVVAFLVSKEKLEQTMETLSILANPEAMKAIRKAEAGLAKYYPLESLDED